MNEPTVLVTGAARGIGRATVERFLALGWSAVAGVRDVEAARAALPDDPRLLIVPLDVTVPEQVAEGVAAAERHAGGALRCVVPNAGYAVLGAEEDVDLGEARAMFETNFFGNAAVVQAALPAMREAGTGSLVFVSSIGARLVNPLLGMYHASRWAVHAWADALCVELRPFGVRVHVVEPGMVNTDFSKATRVTGSVATGEGAYQPLWGQLRHGFGSWRERLGIGPHPVGEAVAAAALDPATPFRVTVGDDAAQMGAARERLGDEDFHDWHLRFLEMSWGLDGGEG